jgi:hypothetical protein
MSLGLRADPTNTSAVISVAGTDQVVITNAGNVVATTFTGALAGNATSATKLSTATGAAPSYGARAWVNFNGLRNTSNVADLTNTNRFIRASGNVSNVLRNGAGDYTVNFSIPMEDTNYILVGTAADANDDALPLTFTFNNSSLAGKTASSQAFELVYGGVRFDSPLVNLVVFR